jgi:hypothetical protein
MAEYRGRSTWSLGAMADSLSPWDIGVAISAPCADISFSSLPNGRIRVLMRFSLVVGGIPDDLELIFDRAAAMNWADEAVHSVSVPMPTQRPRLPAGKWDGWTYPLLRVNESSWLSRFEFLPNCRGLTHFLLVAMNDIVDIVAGPAPSVRWIPSTGA